MCVCVNKKKTSAHKSRQQRETRTRVSQIITVPAAHVQLCYGHTVETVCKNYLIDLIHHSEGTAVELLQSHEVKHGGDTALSSTLMVRRQLVELGGGVKLHPDADPVLVVLLLRQKHSVFSFFVSKDTHKNLIHSQKKGSDHNFNHQ